jgi:hypothetical protein
VISTEVYYLGDLKIDWLSSGCPLKKNEGKEIVYICILSK